MTDQEAKDTIAALQRVTAEACKSPETARQFLIDAGIIEGKKSEPAPTTPAESGQYNAALAKGCTDEQHELNKLRASNKELKEALGQFVHAVEHEGEVHGRIVDAVENAKALLNK